VSRLGAVVRRPGWAFWGDEASVRRLGELLWPKLAAAYIEGHLKKRLAQVEFQSEEFQAVATAAKEFEDAAAAAGWVLPRHRRSLTGLRDGCRALGRAPRHLIRGRERSAGCPAQAWRRV
jgi:hypothetical protein